MSNKKSGKDNATGSYVQLYVYGVPKKNHGAMVHLQSQLAATWKRHQVLGAEFFQLSTNETFTGFTSIANTVSADPGEEVWVELQYYRGREHRDKVVAKIRRDASAGRLFRRFWDLTTQGRNSIMGEFDRLKV